MMNGSMRMVQLAKPVVHRDQLGDDYLPCINSTVPDLP
jgi:hypothetical protein